MGATWESVYGASQPLLESEWSSVLPFLDVWLQVAENEVRDVQKVVSTLDWDGGRLGARMRLEPKDAAQLQQEYVCRHRCRRRRYRQLAPPWLRSKARLQATFRSQLATKSCGAPTELAGSVFHGQGIHARSGTCVDLGHGLAKPQALDGSEPIDSDPFRGLIRIDKMAPSAALG